MSTLDDLHGFDIDASDLTFWVFKKSLVTGAPPKFNGRWVETEDALNAALKAAVKKERERITEVLEYELLAENNESSALTLTAVETNAGLIVAQTAATLPKKKVAKLKEIQNTSFYVLKMESAGKSIYAVKRAGRSFVGSTKTASI